MAITVTSRGTTTAVNPPEVLSIASAAFSPTASRLILSLDSGFLGYQAGVAVSSTDNIADTGGGAWVQDAYVDIQVNAEGFVRCAHRQLGTAPGASKTVTIQNSGAHMDVWVHNVLEIAGHNTTTPVPTGQAAIGNSATNTVTATLPNAPASTSLIVCGICAPNGPTISVPTGFTVVTNQVLTGDGHGHFYKIGSGPQSVTWSGLTIGGAGYSNICYIVEIAQASGGGGGPADPGFSLADTFGDTAGGVWTKATGTSANGAEVDIYYRRIGTTPGAGTITATSANTTQGRSLTVTEMANRNNDNPVPSGQTAIVAVTTAAETATLPATPSTDSVVVSGTISRGDASAPGTPAGHTALTNVSTGGDGYEASFQAGSAPASTSWSGLATTQNVAAVAEIRAVNSGSGGSGSGYFTASSTWNTPIPAGASFVDEPALRAHGNGGSPPGGWFNTDDYGVPVTKAVPSDPLTTITILAGPGGSVGPSWGWPNTTYTIHCPTTGKGATGTDGTMCVIDGTEVYDFWIFRRDSPTTGHCSAAAHTNTVSGDGWAANCSFPAAGIHAAGASCLAGLIMGNELTQGINHTLAIAIDAGHATGGWICPAINGDGGGGPIPTGIRVGIPPGVPMPGGMNIQEQNVWKCLQKYGAFVIDTAGGGKSVFFWGDGNSISAADRNALINPSNFTTPGLDNCVNALRLVR